VENLNGLPDGKLLELSRMLGLGNSFLTAVRRSAPCDPSSGERRPGKEAGKETTRCHLVRMSSDLLSSLSRRGARCHGCESATCQQQFNKALRHPSVVGNWSRDAQAAYPVPPAWRPYPHAYASHRAYPPQVLQGLAESEFWATWRDLQWCANHTAYTAPLSAACVSSECRGLADASVAYNGTRLAVGIVLCDSRQSHPGISAWVAYAKVHGYRLIRLSPDLKAAAKSNGTDLLVDIMLVDWQASALLLKMLRSPEHASIDYFVYTEADQWMVRPMARLEHVLLRALSPPKVLGISAEFPCMDVRGGGLFNGGTLFIRRNAAAESILEAWVDSIAHGGARDSTWPARQGAFSHDGGVYFKRRKRIYIFASGCVAASPFSPLIGHALGGFIPNVFDPTAGRRLLVSRIFPCVRGALKRRVDRTCAFERRQVLPIGSSATKLARIAARWKTTQKITAVTAGRRVARRPHRSGRVEQGAVLKPRDSATSVGGAHSRNARGALGAHAPRGTRNLRPPALGRSASWPATRGRGRARGRSRSTSQQPSSRRRGSAGSGTAAQI